MVDCYFVKGRLSWKDHDALDCEAGGDYGEGFIWGTVAASGGLAVRSFLLLNMDVSLYLFRSARGKVFDGFKTRLSHNVKSNKRPASKHSRYMSMRGRITEPAAPATPLD